MQLTAHGQYAFRVRLPFQGKKGRAQPRATQDMSASSIRQIPRSPLALTQWPWEDRTGSQYTPKAAIYAPQRRSRVSSFPSRMDPLAETRYGTRRPCSTSLTAKDGPAEGLVKQGKIAFRLQASIQG